VKEAFIDYFEKEKKRPYLISIYMNERKINSIRGTLNI